MLMSQVRGKAPETAADMWDLVRENQSELVGVKKDVSSLGATVSQLSAKMDTVLEAVTRHSAGRGPSLTQIIGGALSLCALIAALASGVGVYVSSSYDGKIVSIQAKADAAEEALAQRDASDRAKLTRFEEEAEASRERRLRALEEQAGWSPTVR
jgi:uncharacterized protein HemX